VRDYLNNQDRVYWDEILFLHSDRNDCFIHTSDKKYVIKRSLSKMVASLDQRFCRIHSSYLINIDFVLKVKAGIVHLAGVQIPLGRTYKKAFLEKINPQKIH
jgi:DNA-binding LytR/AlgR family response regulator